MNRFQQPFQHVQSTAPAFESTFDNTSAVFALEATGVREWTKGPGGRSVRLAGQAGDDFYIAFGDSGAEASSSAGVLVLGGTVEIFHPIRPTNTHLAMYSSTTLNVNICCGYGQ